MRVKLKWVLIVFVFLLTLSTVFAACEVSVSNLVTEVKIDSGTDSSDFDSEVNAELNEYIDVRLSFDLEDYSSSCSSIKAKLRISRYDESKADWVEYKNIEKSIGSLDDYYEIIFENAFNTGSNSNYTEFMIEGMIVEGSRVIDSSDAFLSLIDNSCDGIKIDATTFYIDEDDYDSKNFVIKNETTSDFSISSIELISSNSVIISGGVDYPSEVYSNDSDELEVSLETKNVSTNTNATVLLSISGYLDDKYCSASAIGKKSISVVVRNTNNTSGSSSSNLDSDCEDIQIISNELEFNEGTNQKIIMGVKNNSTKRFEILDVDASSSSFDLTRNTNDKYLFSGQTGDVILNANLPNVSSDKILTGTLKIRGVFSDGKSCSFTQIPSEEINVKVINLTNNSLVPNCAGFNIIAPENLVIENNGSFDFTINNFSNKTARVIIEGSIQVNPTIIVLPKNSSLARKMDVELFSNNGFVKFTPTIEGCNLNSKIVNISNNVSGSISEAEIDLKIQRDYNKGIIDLGIVINNSTNKSFSGVLKIVTPNGWPNIEKTIVIVPGENSLVEKFGASGEASEGEITVSFSSNGQTILDSINTNENNLVLAGLFSLGGNLSSFGIILLIILVVIIIVGIIGDLGESTPTKKEEWVIEKN
jgi:hypothetical protein